MYCLNFRVSHSVLETLFRFPLKNFVILPSSYLIDWFVIYLTTLNVGELHDADLEEWNECFGVQEEGLKSIGTAFDLDLPC